MTMAEKTEALIAEARTIAEHSAVSLPDHADCLTRLADALEAATERARQPSGWSTEDRREARCEAERRWSRPVMREAEQRHQAGNINGFILGAEWQKARETFVSYKEIADGARAERDAALARIAELEAELDASDAAFRSLKVSTGPADARLTRAEARIAEAAKLHRPHRDTHKPDPSIIHPNWFCCGAMQLGAIGPMDCNHCRSEWPCPTVVALGLNEGENDD